MVKRRAAKLGTPSSLVIYLFLFVVFILFPLQVHLLRGSEIFGGAEKQHQQHHDHFVVVATPSNSKVEWTKSNQINKANGYNHSESGKTLMSATTTANQSTNESKCALLFFGLLKDFKDLALPSIQKNIIQSNPTCDIFLHTYNISFTVNNRRNLEKEPYKVKSYEAYLLTENVTMDTEQQFNLVRRKILGRTRRLYHRPWGKCCKSHDNMIKQWHSIKGVWDLMVEHEQGTLATITTTSSSKNDTINTITTTSKQGKRTASYYYDQIGLFRSDVYYLTPINIYDSNATLPNFASYTGYNDRLFYGKREYAKLWADRFAFAQTFEKKYMVSTITRGKKRGYHSESFLYHLLNHNKVPVTLKGICAWRIRTGLRLAVEDCIKADWFAKEDIARYIPEGYVLTVVNDTQLGRNKQNYTTTSLWAHPPPVATTS